MRRLFVPMLVLSLAAAACSSTPAPVRIGAIYPLSGPQSPGGIDEYRGVKLALDMTNADGGLHGRPVELITRDVPGPDGAPAAVDGLARQGVPVIVGSYGSVISEPASLEASHNGIVFWETGAVGSNPMGIEAPGPEELFFRVPPSGATLGSSAVSFVTDQLAPMLHRTASTLRFAVANVDDTYGSAVAAGAVAQIHALRLSFAGQFPYDAARLDATAVVKAIARAQPDVLFVAAYLADGVALRRAMVDQHLHLLASIGTSSAYCMPQFGTTLGAAAVGLFASDKPDEDVLDPAALTPDARALLERAGAAYRAAYGTSMSAPALAGFSAGWALFHDVLPNAASMTPAAISAAAMSVRIPAGGLPNGSGLAFGQPGTPTAGANLRALSVIEEWVSVGRMVVVWPPPFATQPIEAIAIER
jgi:branched-chain amino acid transport system substrate-binding protein